MRQRSVASSRGRQRARVAGLRAVGVAVSKLAAADSSASAAAGILVRLKADWPAIVGAEWALADLARPALGRDGALEAAHRRPTAALELQHRAPLLIERINASSAGRR